MQKINLKYTGHWKIIHCVEKSLFRLNHCSHIMHKYQTLCPMV